MTSIPPVTASTTSAARAKASPWTVRVAAGLLALTAAVHALGVVLFGLVWADDPVGPGVVFTSVALVAAVTAVGALPTLLRGSPVGWCLAAGWAFGYTYWSVYKVFVEEEFESTGFLLAGIGVVALLATASARRHAGLIR